MLPLPFAGVAISKSLTSLQRGAISLHTSQDLERLDGLIHTKHVTTVAGVCEEGAKCCFHHQCTPELQDLQGPTEAKTLRRLGSREDAQTAAWLTGSESER